MELYTTTYREDRALRKTIFLDRDGTINIDHGYVYRKEDFQFLPGVLKGLKLLEQLGFLLVIITNQSGIARGYYTEDEYHELNKWLLNELKKEGIHIASSFYCPHHPEAKVEEYRMSCECRKPGTALYKQACAQWDVDTEKSYAIGDKERDVSFCGESDVKGIILYQEKECLEGKVRMIQGGVYEAALMIKKDMENEHEG